MFFYENRTTGFCLFFTRIVKPLSQKYMNLEQRITVLSVFSIGQFNVIFINWEIGGLVTKII